MKKLAVIMLFALAAFSQVAFAQNSTPFKVDAHKFAEEYDAAAKTTTNTRVLDNFSRMFKDASNVIWSKDKHVDRVYFESKGKVTRAAFNQKGQFLYSITSYGEEYLPKDILMMVKDTYFGKSIFDRDGLWIQFGKHRDYAALYRLEHSFFVHGSLMSFMGRFINATGIHGESL